MDISPAVKCEGLFTCTVSVPVSVKVTVKVYHCANSDGLFGEQIESGSHSVGQCKYDVDGDGTCKRTLIPLFWTSGEVCAEF